MARKNQSAAPLWPLIWRPNVRTSCDLNKPTKKLIHYCNELLVCAMLVLSFIAIQQGHLRCRHNLTTSWLQIGHTHFSSLGRNLYLF